MKMLLHICCAPCSTATVEAWRMEAVELAGVFFNPNIHPLSEHKRRHDTLLSYAGRIELPLIGEPLYDITGWLRQVHGQEKKSVRCRICISQRMRHTAELAAAARFDAFSTTLLISPWQEHEIIREEGERAAADFGVKFRYRDMRSEYRRSTELSREAELYRQKYCGCIYSEAEAEQDRDAARRRTGHEVARQSNSHQDSSRQTSPKAR